MRDGIDSNFTILNEGQYDNSSTKFEDAKIRLSRFIEDGGDNTYEWNTIMNTDDLKAFEFAIKCVEAVEKYYEEFL